MLSNDHDDHAADSQQNHQDFEFFYSLFEDKKGEHYSDQRCHVVDNRNESQRQKLCHRVVDKVCCSALTCSE